MPPSSGLLAFASSAALVVLLALLLGSGGAHQLPNLSLRKHALPAAQAYLARLSRAKMAFNHEHSYSICSAPGSSRGDAAPPGFVSNLRRVRLGRGAADFRLAASLLLNFAFINADTLPWADVVVATPIDQPGPAGVGAGATTGAGAAAGSQARAAKTRAKVSYIITIRYG